MVCFSSAEDIVDMTEDEMFGYCKQSVEKNLAKKDWETALFHFNAFKRSYEGPGLGRGIRQALSDLHARILHSMLEVYCPQKRKKILAIYEQFGFKDPLQ